MTCNKTCFDPINTPLINFFLILHSDFRIATELKRIEVIYINNIVHVFVCISYYKCVIHFDCQQISNQPNTEKKKK